MCTLVLRYVAGEQYLRYGNKKESFLIGNAILKLISTRIYLRHCILETIVEDGCTMTTSDRKFLS